MPLEENKTNIVRLFIVDDHPLVREGLKKVLRNESDFAVVGEATTAQELFDHLSENQPDIIILDFALPDRSGWEILQDLREQYPKVLILILSMLPEEQFGVRAFKAGASGYITKQMAAEELIKAIHMVISGKKYASAKLVQQITEELREGSSSLLHERLSNREFEVMIRVAKGEPAGEIANALSLSIHTITTYRARVLEKMNMKTNADIVRYAVENGLIQ